MNMHTYMQFKKMNSAENREINKLKTIPGIWVDGKTYWLEWDSEKIMPEEMITIKQKKRSIHSNVCLQDVYITNHQEKKRQCKLLFAHCYEKSTQDHFTFISPMENFVYHLADHVIYLVNGHYYGEKITQSTIQPYWNFRADKIWSQSEKGILQYQPMAKGAAVSIVGMDVTLMPKETTVGTGWVIFGKSKKKLLKLNRIVANSY